MKELNVNLKMICFDMDGTIADLYKVKGWLKALREFNPMPYRVAEPMWNMDELALLLMEFQKMGIQVNIITWLSKETTPTYDRQVRNAKIDWLRHYDFPFDHFYGVDYGVRKSDVIQQWLGENETAILIDDNAEVRKDWDVGATIDPTTCDIIEVLKSLL